MLPAKINHFYLFKTLSRKGIIRVLVRNSLLRIFCVVKSVQGLSVLPALSLKLYQQVEWDKCYAPLSLDQLTIFAFSSPIRFWWSNCRATCRHKGERQRKKKIFIWDQENGSHLHYELISLECFMWNESINKVWLQDLYFNSCVSLSPVPRPLVLV